MINIMIENTYVYNKRDFISLTSEQFTMLEWLYEKGYLGETVSWCDHIEFDPVEGGVLE